MLIARRRLVVPSNPQEPQGPKAPSSSCDDEKLLRSLPGPYPQYPPLASSRSRTPARAVEADARSKACGRVRGACWARVGRHRPCPLYWVASCCARPRRDSTLVGRFCFCFCSLQGPNASSLVLTRASDWTEHWNGRLAHKQRAVI